MKKFLLALLLCVSAGICAQNPADNVVTRYSRLVVSDGHYYGNNGPISKREFYASLQTCPLAYHAYKSGRAMQISGDVFLGAGLGLTVGGLIWEIIARTSKESTTPGWCMTAAGSIVTLAIGTPLQIGGNRKMKNGLFSYNNQCRDYSASLQLQVSDNGLGLALNF
ncbi:MAG: hypothetical protein MJZ64_07915 [Paludibacteraceae bacterium]|nr:hypothetical protein [Paludibacteraceae bacterium]